MRETAQELENEVSQVQTYETQEQRNGFEKVWITRVATGNENRREKEVNEKTKF